MVNASDSFLLRFSMIRSMQRKWLDVSIMSSTLTVSSFSTPIVLVSKMYVSGRRSDGCPQCCWSCRSAPPVICDRYRLCNRYAFCPRVFQRGWMVLSLLSRRTWAWSRSRDIPCLSGQKRAIYAPLRAVIPDAAFGQVPQLCGLLYFMTSTHLGALNKAQRNKIRPVSTPV